MYDICITLQVWKWCGDGKQAEKREKEEHKKHQSCIEGGFKARDDGGMVESAAVPLVVCELSIIMLESWIGLDFFVETFYVAAKFGGEWVKKNISGKKEINGILEAHLLTPSLTRRKRGKDGHRVRVLVLCCYYGWWWCWWWVGCCYCSKCMMAF